MAILLQVKSVGNQSFRSSYDNNLYEWDISWNDRVSRFFLNITNISTGINLTDQLIEPFSVCTLTGLGFNNLYLLPALLSVTYNEDGSYAMQYSDIGSNLKLILVTVAEIKTLEDTYGPITVLAGLLT